MYAWKITNKIKRNYRGLLGIPPPCVSRSGSSFGNVPYILEGAVYLTFCSVLVKACGSIRLFVLTHLLICIGQGSGNRIILASLAEKNLFTFY